MLIIQMRWLNDKQLKIGAKKAVINRFYKHYVYRQIQ
jgi:hypothetical protein